MYFSNHFCVFCINIHFSCVCLHWIPWVPRLLFAFFNFSLGSQNRLVPIDVYRRYSIFVLKFHICFIPKQLFLRRFQDVLASHSRVGSESSLLFALSSVVTLGVLDIVRKVKNKLYWSYFFVFRYILQNLERREWRKSKFKDQ